MPSIPALYRLPQRARLVLVALCCTHALAAAAPAIDCGERPIRLAFFENGYAYSDGVGIDKDLADEIERRSGCRFVFSIEPRARIWADLESGTLDMATFAIETPERDQFVWYAMYLATKFYALVRKDVARTVKSGADFMARPELKFGAVRAFRHGPAQERLIDQLRASQRIDECADVKVLFKKFQARRFEAMFAEPLTFKKYLRDLNIDNDYVIEDWTPNQADVPHGLVMSKHRFTEAQAAQWQRLISAMRTDGTLERMFRRYFPAADVIPMLKVDPPGATGK